MRVSVRQVIMYLWYYINHLLLLFCLLETEAENMLLHFSAQVALF